MTSHDHHQAPHDPETSHDPHDHDLHDHDLMAMFTAEYWDGRYGSADSVWSGNPNPRLVSTVEPLPPGDALDVGAGEGADAIWLATRGWRVTGVDISQVALDRAAAVAEKVGADVAARITWQQADVFGWTPERAAYDLVSAQFMHLPWEELQALHRKLAAAVRPGGTLLIVGHHPSDVEAFDRPAHHAAMMFTAERMAATFDPAEWEIEASNPARAYTSPEGKTVTLHDAIVRAARR